jgi:hypothetical protein
MMTLAVVLLGAIAPAPLTGATAASAQAGASGGAWGPVEDWPLIAIHAALDVEGRVVTYGTDGGGRQTGRFVYDRWIPGASAAADHEILPNTTRTDLFCSLQLNRSDTGEMLIFGGDNWTGADTTNTGNPDINSLSPDSGTLTTLPGLHRPRWYGTGTILPDGTMLIMGGKGGEDHPELWTPDRGAVLLDHLDTSWLDWWYPHNFVLPDGRIFGIDNLGWMYVITADLSTLTAAGRLGEDRQGLGTTAVMYQPGKIIQFGGSTNSSVLIDMTGATPVVTPGPELSSPRKWVNGTLLPDGRVLATGGADITGPGVSADIGDYAPNNAAEVWDPATNTWTVQSSGQVARMYHSTGLLLPDGRVLVSGGGAPGPLTNANAELFSPDYLVSASGGATGRPTITDVSATEVVPGQTIDLGTSSSNGISAVTLVKMGSVTHSFNMEQRFLDLPFTASGGGVLATVPADEAVVTPGYYLLTVLDGAGVPSESRIVHVQLPDPTRLVSVIDGQISRLYRAYFLRQPDASGFRYWRRLLLAGSSLDRISDEFAISAEFTSRYGHLTDPQFIDQIYRNVLGRAPDASGRAYWIGILGSGTSRGRVMTEFSESPEFVDTTGTPPPNGEPVTPAQPTAPSPAGPTRDQIARLYLGYFSRPADEEGLAYWQGQSANGATLAVMSDAFAASQEFKLRYGGTTDSDFVDLVYRNVMGREPDAGGRAYWIDQLGRGLTRGVLMIQFTESPEFVNRTADQI